MVEESHNYEESLADKLDCNINLEDLFSLFSSLLESAIVRQLRHTQALAKLEDCIEP
jgi:hypothetical protein